MIQKEAYSISEVATLLGISERTVRRLIKSKELTAARIRQQWRITRADLSLYLQSQGSVGLNLPSKENPVEDGPDGEMWADAA